MTVTENLMKPGSFSVELIDEYPQSIAAAVDQFDHIVITATHLDPVSSYSDADVLASAIYTGVITSKPSPRIFEGSGMGYWLGTPNGLGDILESPVSRTAGTLAQWVADLCPDALAVGTVTNTGSTVSNTFQWVTRREALDAVCTSVGAEWRVNPDGTLDAAAVGTLFVATPTAVVTRKPEGVGSGTLLGFRGSMIVTAEDVEQYTTRVVAVAKGQGSTTPTGAANGAATPYVDLFGNPVVMTRLVNAPTEPEANATTLAAAIVGQYDAKRRELSLTSDTYNVTRSIRPGDWVYAYDQLAGLVDTGVQVTFRGELINPVALRVYGLTWPVERGMGVYARAGATGTYTDLTPWVAWESDEVRWDVGALPRPIVDTDATVGSTAYLGANPDVAERIAAAAGQEVAYAEVTATQSGITATVDVTGLSVSFTSDGSRKYRIIAEVYVLSTVADDTPSIQITDASNVQLQSGQVAIRPAGNALKLIASKRDTPAAGSVTYKVRANLASGTGSVSVVAGAQLPAFIQVLDLGPA